MAKGKEAGLSQFKPKKKKVSIVRVAIIILFIAMTVFLTKSIANIISLQNEKEAAEKKHEELTRQVEILTNELENINSDEYIELLARRNLKLVKNREKLYILPSFETEESEESVLEEDMEKAEENE